MTASSVQLRIGRGNKHRQVLVCFMNSKVLSIVVTAHNLEGHIKKTLESILLAADNKVSSCELILIDDASVDGTSNILREFADKNENAFYFRTEFKNIGKVRNFAIDKCQGEYITMVDGDDLVYEKSLAQLIDFLENNDVDILISPLYEIKGEIPLLDNWQWKTPQKIFQEVAIEEFLIHKKFQGHFIGKIVKKSLFRNSHFPEFYCYEDIALIPEILHKAESVYFCEWPFYIYIKQPHSLSSALSAEKLELKAKALLMMDAELGSEWRHLTASHVVQLLYKHKNKLSKGAQDAMYAILQKTSTSKFFLSSSVRLSMKKKYILLKFK
jgi:glycosyltransferase involved in cell wall biosynthesis